MIKRLKTLKAAVQLSTIHFVDFLVIPWYVDGRASLFQALGSVAPPLLPEENTEVQMQEAIAEVLETNLSEKVWVARGSWMTGFPHVYLITHVYPMGSPQGTVMMVDLKERETGEDVDQSVPLSEFFEFFEPEGKINIGDLDS